MDAVVRSQRGPRHDSGRERDKRRSSSTPTPRSPSSRASWRRRRFGSCWRRTGPRRLTSLGAAEVVYDLARIVGIDEEVVLLDPAQFACSTPVRSTRRWVWLLGSASRSLLPPNCCAVSLATPALRPRLLYRRWRAGHRGSAPARRGAAVKASPCTVPPALNGVSWAAAVKRLRFGQAAAVVPLTRRAAWTASTPTKRSSMLPAASASSTVGARRTS